MIKNQMVKHCTKIDAKLRIREVKETELTGRSPLRRRRRGLCITNLFCRSVLTVPYAKSYGLCCCLMQQRYPYQNPGNIMRIQTQDN
jgi:hypothetical protein